MLQFAPWHAAIGGLAIGTLSAGKTVLTGRILGISGAFKCVSSVAGLSHRGFFLGDARPWRVLFLGGLIGGGAVLRRVLPGSLENLPGSYSFSRAILAGLLVGAGTGIGNGCTSGHGIAGLSRFSLRSFAYTCVFMATAMVSTTLGGTPKALKIAPEAPKYVTPTALEVNIGLGILAAAVVTTAGLGMVLKRNYSKSKKAEDGLGADYDTGVATSTQSDASGSSRTIARSVSGTTTSAQEPTPRTPRLHASTRDLPETPASAPKPDGAVTLLFEYLAGLEFAFALGFSRMTKPSVVASFLAPFQPFWNFTLAFVMGGGLLVATPVMQKLVRRRTKSLSGNSMAVPSCSDIDAKLILGGILFGAGWGYGGLCPGPALVALGNPQPKIAMFCSAMFVGMWGVTGLPKMLGMDKKAKTGIRPGGVGGPRYHRRVGSGIVGMNQRER